MNITRCVIPKDCSRLAGLFLVFFIFVSASSCLEGVDGQKSNNPIGTQQIVVNAFPVAVFGNACEFVDIEALFNELLTPDGATIEVDLTGSTLTFNLRGCITFFDPVVIDGRADVEYLSPPSIGVGNLDFVNVAVTSILQGGSEASNFVTLVIQGVGIVSITAPDMITSEPDVFATIVLNTFGIPPGTIVNFQLTNNSCGFLSNPTPVLGSVFEGVAIVQYNPVEGTECTQTIIVTIILPNPPSKDPDCPPIPVENRTIEASVTFDQVVAPQPTPTPTPGPTPPPGPTPTPTPGPSIDVMAFNDTIEPNGSTIVTATVSTGPGTDVCCDIPIQSMPMSLLGFPPAAPPDCGSTDINGDFFTPLEGGDVGTLQTIQVRCCIDSNTMMNMCDPGEPQDSVFVDINPAGVPPPITLMASPSTIPPGGTSTITGSTMPSVFPGEICFEIVVGTAVADLFNGGPSDGPLCFPTTSSGQAVVGLEADAAVMTQQAVTVLGCINLDPMGDDTCDPADPSNFVTVIISPPAPTPPPTPPPPPPPPLFPIQIVDVGPPAAPGAMPEIDVLTSQPQNTVLCVEILTDNIAGGTTTIAGPIGPPITPVGTACAFADAAGDVTGPQILLTIPLLAVSGQQVSLDGCIDVVPNDFMCMIGTDIFSPAIVVTVP